MADPVKRALAAGIVRNGQLAAESRHDFIRNWCVFPFKAQIVPEKIPPHVADAVQRASTFEMAESGRATGHHHLLKKRSKRPNSSDAVWDRNSGIAKSAHEIRWDVFNDVPESLADLFIGKSRQQFATLLECFGDQNYPSLAGPSHS